MKGVFIFLLLVIFVSCNILENTKVVCETLTLTEETMPPVQPLKLEKMDIPEDYLMGCASCVIYQDSILLALKDVDPYPFTHMLNVINLNNGDIIGEYFTRGKGPGEVLSMLGRLSNNYLDIYDYTTRKLIPFNIDSAIIFGNKYFPNIINVKDVRFSEWASVSDTSFYVSNSVYAESNICKENSLLPEFYKINMDGSTYPNFDLADYKKIIYSTSSVYSQTISINKEKKRMVCCYMHQPCIKIFDENLNVIKEIDGPEPDDAQYEPMGNMMYFQRSDGMSDYYGSATCDDMNIFVTNSRTRKCIDTEHYLDMEVENREIFHLDWDGNVIARYSAKGKNVVRVSYSKSSNTLYLWVYDDDRTMYKAKLDRL